MIIKLDRNLLIELGLSSLDADQQARVLRKLYTVLEVRVGIRLAREMSDKKREEFESLIPRDPERGESGSALEWITQNFPEHPLIVQDEYDQVVARIRERIETAIAKSTEIQASTDPAI